MQHSIRLFILLACLCLAGSQAHAQSQLGSFRLLKQYANDMVYDTVSGKIILSIPSKDFIKGNSIGFLDPDSNQIGATYFVGSEPRPLELTYNNRYIYVGLDGAQALKKFDLQSKTIVQTINNFGSSSGYPRYVRTMTCQPGNDSTIVIAFKVANVVPSSAGVAAYRGAIRLRDTIRNFPDLVNSPRFFDSSHIYALDNQSSAYSFFSLSFDSTGPHMQSKVAGLVPGNDLEFYYQGSKAITDNGKVLDLTTNPISTYGTFSLTKNWTNFNPKACYDKALDLWCFASWGFDNDSIYLERFQASNFLRKDLVRICKAKDNVTRILYLGDSSCYAISTNDSVLILVDSMHAVAASTALAGSAAPAARLKVYPNPVTNLLHIDYPREVRVQLYNTGGALVMETNNRQTISLKALPAGCYMLCIMDPNGRLLRMQQLQKE